MQTVLNACFAAHLLTQHSPFRAAVAALQVRTEPAESSGWAPGVWGV